MSTRAAVGCLKTFEAIKQRNITCCCVAVSAERVRLSTACLQHNDMNSVWTEEDSVRHIASSWGWNQIELTHFSHRYMLRNWNTAGFLLPGFCSQARQHRYTPPDCKRHKTTTNETVAISWTKCLGHLHGMTWPRLLSGFEDWKLSVFLFSVIKVCYLGFIQQKISSI